MEHPELKPQIFVQIKVGDNWHRIDIVNVANPYHLEKLDVAIEALFPDWTRCIVEPFHGAKFMLGSAEHDQTVNLKRPVPVNG